MPGGVLLVCRFSGRWRKGRVDDLIEYMERLSGNRKSRRKFGFLRVQSTLPVGGEL